MKAVVAVLCFLAVFHAVSAIGFTGSITSGSKNLNYWLYPQVSYNGCKNTSTTTPYISFNVYITSSNSTMYHVYALVGSTFDSFMSVLIYDSTFDPAHPCQGLITYLKDSNDDNNFLGSSLRREGLYFSPGVYTFVVTTSLSAYTTQFAIALDPVDQVVEIDATSPQWVPPEFENTQCTVYSGYTTKPMALYNITVETTGYYDVLALGVPAVNSSEWIQMYLAIYNSSFNIADLQTSGCQSLFQWRLFDETYAYISYLYLEAGATYTAIVSGTSDTNYAQIGFEVVPTRMRYFSTAVTFPGIDYFSALQGSCKQSSGSSYWAAASFVAAHSDFAVDVTPPTFSYPTRQISSVTFSPTGILYLGENSGTFNETAPTPCPSGSSKYLSYAVSGGTLFATGYAGSTYTVVVTPNSEDQLKGSGYALNVYAISGTNVNGVADQTTGASNNPTATSQSSQSSQTSQSSTANADNSGDATITGVSSAILLFVFALYLC